MKRKIITIDAEKCTGCGACVNGCPEGALQLIDGKAYVINETLCDGLGACIDTCPEDAITIEEREAKAYDEREVLGNILPQGEKVLAAHIKHLRDHGQMKYLKEAMALLKEKAIDLNPGVSTGSHAGCPGARMMQFDTKDTETQPADSVSSLRQWPIQLHLVSPFAPYYEGKDVLISADCVAYALGGFHSRFLKGKSLVIACPKLDSNLDVYRDKITALIDEAGVNTLMVLTMEVPCCMGLLRIVQEATGAANRKVPVKHVVVGIKGDVLKDDWL